MLHEEDVDFIVAPYSALAQVRHTVTNNLFRSLSKSSLYTSKNTKTNILTRFTVPRSSFFMVLTKSSPNSSKSSTTQMRSWRKGTAKKFLALAWKTHRFSGLIDGIAWKSLEEYLSASSPMLVSLRGQHCCQLSHH